MLRNIVCVSSEWNVNTEEIIHYITVQCKFFKKGLSFVSFLWTRWKYFSMYISYLGHSFVVYRMPRATVDIKQFLVIRSLHHQNANFTPEYVGHLLNNLKKYMVKMLFFMYSDYLLQRFSSVFNILKVPVLRQTAVQTSFSVLRVKSFK